MGFCLLTDSLHVAACFPPPEKAQLSSRPAQLSPRRSAALLLLCGLAFPSKSRAGHLRLARLVKACPFVIYGGFMAGTGAVRSLSHLDRDETTW